MRIHVCRSTTRRGHEGAGANTLHWLEPRLAAGTNAPFTPIERGTTWELVHLILTPYRLVGTVDS
jgi:hypothetical protein